MASQMLMQLSHLCCSMACSHHHSANKWKQKKLLLAASDTLSRRLCAVSAFEFACVIAACGFAAEKIFFTSRIALTPTWTSLATFGGLVTLLSLTWMFLLDFV